MLTLAIDTAFKAAGAALAQGGEVLGEAVLGGPASHSRKLMRAVDFLLTEAGVSKKDIEGLAVTLGPGFFTGLRIGLASAQGLALGLGVPVCGFSSLRLLAQSAGAGSGLVWAVADARRGLVYAAPFMAGPDELTRLEGDAAMTPAKLAERLDPPARLVGDGARLFWDELAKPGLELAPVWMGQPRPGVLALLGEERLAQGQGMPPEQLKPRYLRPSDAEVRFGLPLDGYRLIE